MSDIKQKAREWHKEWLEGDYGFDFNEYLADKVQQAIDLAIKERESKIVEVCERCVKAFKKEKEDDYLPEEYQEMIGYNKAMIDVLDFITNSKE